MIHCSLRVFKEVIRMALRKDKFNGPMTDEERKFAEENLYLVFKYLKQRHLSPDEWFDVVIFRYCRSVKRWFAIPELHQYKFSTIAFWAMRSAIGHEIERRNRRLMTFSLDEVIPGTDGLTYADVVTEENLNYI